MTDTEFTEMDLQKEVSEMEPDEARETLVDFMEAHQSNRSAYDELSTELDEVETEYNDKLEEKDEVIAEFKQERAAEAAEYVKMPEDILADKFSFSELEQIIEEAEDAPEFSESDEGTEDGEEDDTLTTFSEKPERGEAGGDTGPSDAAKERLRSKW
jgi:hypothetical protein